MTPTFVTEIATRVYSKRRAVLICALAGLGAIAACVAYGTPGVGRFAAAMAGPVIGIPWAILCAVSWFHPESGSMNILARREDFLPRWLPQLIRWFGAVFLACVLFLAAVLPALTYFNL